MGNFYRLIKVVLIVLSLQICLSTNATDFQKIKYKNLEDGAKISTEGLSWSTKVNKKLRGYYVKKVPEGVAESSEFYSPNGNFLFSTGTQYEFINKGSLIGYSNYDLKFYEFSMKDSVLQQRELLFEEVQDLFPQYQVVKITDFSNKTNSLKIKKKGSLKLILLNDTDRSFYNYAFTTNNAKYKTYELKGFLDVTKTGMIHFSKFGENAKNTPWFVLLIR